MASKDNLTKRRVSSEKEHIKLLNSEEIKAREVKYFRRLTDLKKCLGFIDDALKEVYNYKEHKLLQDKWQDFVTCNPLPKPYIPPDVRLFYSKLKYMEKKNFNKEINWLLSVNERSLLSQDIYRQDLTRRTLAVTLKEDIGQEYNNYIGDSIKILQRIENFLDNDEQVYKCPIDVLEDIAQRKLMIQNEIIDLMDRFTYRIISSENSEMKSIDAITAEYFFRAADFKIHIWCLKNVAVRFSHLSEPRMLAEFHSLKLLLHIPLDMLQENLTIRALHMHFDHLSETANSFKHSLPSTNENSKAGILDLHDCLVNEWFEQMEMQAKKIQQMEKTRLEYEERMRQYQQEVEKIKEQNKTNKKTNKTKTIKRPPKAPAAIETGMSPDIYEEFLEQEQIQNESFFEESYSPEILNLSPDEINLRQYFILGGVYQLYYVQKPLHIDFNKLSMSWHYDDSKLEIDKSFRVTSQLELSASMRFTRRMTVFEVEKISTDPDIECPWFIITIELPEYLCYWGEPIACQFEQTSRRVEKAETSMLEVSPASKTADIEALTQSDLSVQDDSSLKRKRLMGSQKLEKDRFFDDSLANFLLHKRQRELVQRGSKAYLYIEDFSLLKTLTKPEIRHIERHIVPRIISSYKFPTEVQHEEAELFNKKFKRKGGRILRQNIDDFPHKLSSRQFTFTQRQNNAERIFAKYPEAESLHIISYLKELNLLEDEKEPETFAQLLQVVEDIKNKYELVKNKILDLKPIEKDVITRNKRIRQMLKNKQSSSPRPTGSIGIPSTKSSLLKSTKRNTKSPDRVDNEVNAAVNFSKPRTDSLVKDDLIGINAQENDEQFEIKTYLHWTTEHIIKSEFSRESRKYVLYTDRLGNFGFAFKRYEHFPFKNWSLEPNAKNPDNEVIFTLDTKHVRCVIYITASGIRGHVTEQLNSYVHNPKMFLVIEEPIKDFKEFQKLLQEKNLNMFPECDAGFYIENSCFSEKHLSNELHTYNCMSIHCTQMRFNYSLWNRLAKRRDIILKFNQYKDVPENLVEVRISPGEAFFVEIQELCSEDLNEITLDYNLTWRNIESYSDLHYLIVSMYPNATDLRCKNAKLICFVRELLSGVRILSFS